MLLKRRYSMHFYLDFLLYSAECLKTLTIDDLHVINSRLIPVDENDATVPIPVGEIVTGVFIPMGQKLHPLVEDDSLNSVPNYTSNFQTISPYLNYNNANFGWQGWVGWQAWSMTVTNFYGEPTGRAFGWAGGSGNDTYRIIKSRNVIQLNDYILGQFWNQANNLAQSVVVTSTGTGQSVDAATHIDILADETIKAYIIWQMKENSRTYTDNEAQRSKGQYIEERIKLRARISDLTITKMTRILQKNSRASK